VFKTPSILCESQRRLVIVSLALYMYMYIDCVVDNNPSVHTTTEPTAALLFLDYTETKYVITPL
jgi:hypothetical protein